MEILLFTAFLSLAAAIPNNYRALNFQPRPSLNSINPPKSVSLKCPDNQHWSSCNSHCGKSCTTYHKSVPCPPICIPGCVCDEGYVWGSDEECILLDQCEPPKVDSSSSEIADFCPPNEEFSRCLAHCQRNCSNWSDPSLPCPKICVPGCICKNGMVRGPHGTCIKPRKCPSREFLTTIDEEIDCPLDEHLVQCTAHCQKNCSNWNEDVKCQKNTCVKGCVCDKGYVRSSIGRCILSEKCPPEQELPQERERETEFVCPENEQKSKYRPLPYSKNLCVLDETQITICPLNYLNGCVCNQGLFRDPDNKCIELRKLPRLNEIDFMHVVNLELSDDYEDDDYDSTTTDDKVLMEYYDDSIDLKENTDQLVSGSQDGNSDSQDILKILLDNDLSNGKVILT